MNQIDEDRLKGWVRDAYAHYNAIRWNPDWGDIMDFVATLKAEADGVDRSTIDLDELNLQMQAALGCEDEEGEVDA